MKRLVLVLSIIAGFLGASAAEAAKNVALVIGNNAYQGITPLKKAVNDADAIATTLKTIGFDVDLGENLTRRETNAKFTSFIARIEPGDTAFFFFSGHGVALEGRNMLLSVDVPAAQNADMIRDEAHVVDELIRRVNEKGAAVSFFVLDACRNNPFGTSGGKSIGTGKGLQVVAPPSGSFVLMAAGAGQEALDRLSETDAEPTSVFTRYLVPLLATPGMSHIALAKRVQREVADTAAKIGHAQQPAFYDEIKGEIYLVPAGTASTEQTPVEVAKLPDEQVTRETKALEVDPALTEWNAVKDTDSPAILKSFIGKYKGSSYADYASARLDELNAERTKAEEKAEPVLKQREVAKLDPEPAFEEPAPAAGGWFVIVGSYPHADRAKARSRANLMANKGFNAQIIDTDEYSSLRDGLYSVVMGPYKKSTAQKQLSRVKRQIGDAYIKEAR
ncbi:caspase family protein [Pararhizobium sp.]|uniref:caspase family protein n=1 Tax=Pararhizobium sp. TaxID=1977563 RepID=UPI002717B629|nr:caspase family protein [Pararhizobium sp.]MDO9418602.1 caspase family protein [Pararhizobium sp.]